MRHMRVRDNEILLYSFISQILFILYVLFFGYSFIFPDPVKVSVSSNRIKNVIGMPLIIECNITGNPIIQNFWVSPKGLNATFDHILDIETHEYYVIAVMKIMELKLEDFGAYTCVGGNHLGNDYIKVAVMPICKPTHLIYIQSYVCNGVFF